MKKFDEMQKMADEVVNKAKDMEDQKLLNIYQNKHVSEELKKEWEREFDEKFDYTAQENIDGYSILVDKEDSLPMSKEQLLDFINLFLTKQQEEFVKCLPNPKIHSLPDGVNSPHETEHDRGWNDCIADIKSKLNI
jgi:hypothetical protein